MCGSYDIIFMSCILVQITMNGKVDGANLAESPGRVRAGQACFVEDHPGVGILKSASLRDFRGRPR